MARSFLERWRQTPGAETLNVLGHVFGIGGPPPAIVLACAWAAFPAWQIVAGLAAGAWIASVREFVDDLPIESWGDTALDWATITLGGMLSGIVCWLVT